MFSFITLEFIYTLIVQNSVKADTFAHATSERLIGAVVEKNAIIGAICSTIAGVRIGENAVVGAGAVVTMNLATNTVVVGVLSHPYIARKEYGKKMLRWEKTG